MIELAMKSCAVFTFAMAAFFFAGATTKVINDVLYEFKKG